MILQELIRNIVLYNGFIQPLIQTVKEQMIRLYGSSLKETSAKNISQTSDFVAKSLRTDLDSSLDLTTGTRTIPNTRSLIWNGLSTESRVSTETSAAYSTTTITVLVDERVVDTNQTYLFTESLPRVFLSGSAIPGETLTTGFFVRHTFLYFSHETHEKREYLGEFSLPHEENRFNSLNERR